MISCGKNIVLTDRERKRQNTLSSAHPIPIDEKTNIISNWKSQRTWLENMLKTSDILMVAAMLNEYIPNLESTQTIFGYMVWYTLRVSSTKFETNLMKMWQKSLIFPILGCAVIWWLQESVNPYSQLFAKVIDIYCEHQQLNLKHCR